MVGAPKTLHDLRKVEASVRVTCRSCHHVTSYDREQLIHDRRFAHRSMEWEVVRHDLPCRSCDGRDVDVAGVPFGQNDREVKEQRARALLMNLALLVLEDAARRASSEPVASPALRLALRVLRPYLADRELLVTFWQQAEESIGKPWNGAHHAMRWIVNALVQRGHPVWAEFR